MKTRTHHTFTMSLCSFMLFFLIACGGNGGGASSNTNAKTPRGEISARFEANAQNPLIGTWVSGGYSLTFKSDNTYLREFNHEGSPAVRGSAMVSGNLIRVTDADGRHPCINTDGQVESGAYTYAISSNTLTFSLFHDPCSDRAAFLGLTYTKQ